VKRGNDAGLEGDVVVVSPHLDDAVFSLGAAIAKATRSRATVRVLTVFAGDPDASGAAGWWDRKAGFESEGAAARTRRQEDDAACRILGARPEWLPFRDASYEPPASDEEIRAALLEAVGGAGALLVPGFPLRHVDHLRLTRLILDGPKPTSRIGLYVEQPYAKWDGKRRPRHRPSLLPAIQQLVDQQLTWTSIKAARRDRRAKHRASLAYASQLPLFGRFERPFLGRLLLRRVALYEALRGGETVAWLD
jgi:LmbE family N-acetylglucosaminyl deacetylase